MTGSKFKTTELAHYFLHMQYRRRQGKATLWDADFYEEKLTSSRLKDAFTNSWKYL